VNSETTLVEHSVTTPYPYFEWRFWRQYKGPPPPVKTTSDQDQRIPELEAGKLEMAATIGAYYRRDKHKDNRIAELESFEAFMRQSQYQGYPVWRVLEWWQSTKGHGT
jgi:hypothetical protein